MLGTIGNLVADSSQSTGVKWAAGGLTLITTASFSSVADTGTTFDSVFSSTYNHYVAFIYCTTSAGAPDLQMQLRYAGPTTQTTGYTTLNTKINQTPTTSTTVSNNQAQYRLAVNGVGGTDQGQTGIVNIFWPNNGTIYTSITSTLTAIGPGEWNDSAGYLATTRNYTGFLMKLSSGNISGTISVYGVAK